MLLNELHLYLLAKGGEFTQHANLSPSGIGWSLNCISSTNSYTYMSIYMYFVI